MTLCFLVAWFPGLVSDLSSLRSKEKADLQPDSDRAAIGVGGGVQWLPAAHQGTDGETGSWQEATLT